MRDFFSLYGDLQNLWFLFCGRGGKRILSFALCSWILHCSVQPLAVFLF